MTKEFNLSEKIIKRNMVSPNSVILKPSDIKEFIKRLKTELVLGLVQGYARSKGKMIVDRIDKLAGADLI